MLIWWGTNGNKIDLGKIDESTCSICQKTQAKQLVLHYQYSYVWFFFWVTEKQYAVVCDTCLKGHVLDTDEVERNLIRNPIPLWYRYSWMLLIVLFVFGVVLLATGSDEPGG